MAEALQEEKKTKPRRSGVEYAQHLGRRLNAAKATRQPFEPLWDELSKYILPRKAGRVYREENSPDTSDADALFDSTAVYCNQALANGQLSYMTPPGSAWFSFDPPARMKDNDKAAQYFQKCTEIAQFELANSNFYSEIHELYFDDGGFGTTVLLVLPGKRNTLNFEHLPIGSFWIAEDDEGNVDTLFRELNLNARTAAKKFGEKNLSPKMKEALEEAKESGKEGKTFCIGHAIFPREDDQREYGKADGKNKPWASAYWVIGENHIISDAGFDEQPFFCCRHLKNGDSPYGYCPAMMALPDARQLNFLAMQMDALAEITAFPRFLVPSNMIDEVDVRANGMTIYDENKPSALPKEWMTGGRYDIGLDREKRKEGAINKAFYVDLFQMFASYEGPQMTAREVAERASEKLIQFSPTFARKQTEMLGPTLKRIFGLCARAGKFPVPPQEVQEQIGMDETGQPLLGVVDPEIAYNSRVALAIKALHNTAYFRVLESLGPLLQVDPTIIDNFNLDQIMRDVARNEGLPAEWMRLMEHVERIRADRAAAQAQIQQQQAMLSGSQAAKNLAGIPPGSPAAQAIENAAGQQ